jgi:hypothetical protein
MPVPETVRSSRVEVVIVISDEPDAARLDENPENGLAATLAACQEARDIMSGKIKAKTYYSLKELNRELDAEYEAEYGAQC